MLPSEGGVNKRQRCAEGRSVKTMLRDTGYQRQGESFEVASNSVGADFPGGYLVLLALRAVVWCAFEPFVVSVLVIIFAAARPLFP